MSKNYGAREYIKMNCVQPRSSFKIRGIGYPCSKRVKERKWSKLISSSGGNAGLAVAYSGRILKVPVTVVVPETTSEMMRKKIAAEGAEVIVHGQFWDQANELALKLAKEDPSNASGETIHPFDDPYAWDGHSSMIFEIERQFRPHNLKPSVIVTVVGGGGLLCGLLQGLHKIGWQDVPILASETDGAQSFHEAVVQGKVVTIPAITSIARTLGARTVCKEAFEWTKKHKVESVVVSDKEAVDACIRFADDERCLVEVSCGAGLACVYQKIDALKKILDGKKDPIILVIVCGGSAVSLEFIEQWKKQFGL